MGIALGLSPHVQSPRLPLALALALALALTLTLTSTLTLTLSLTLTLTLTLTRCKRLAGRQCPAVRFERVTLVTSAAVADVTRQVYERVLADWQPKVTYSTYLPACLPTYLPAYLPTYLLTYSLSKVTVAVRPVPTSDARLVARANAIAGDDAWFRT